MTGEAEPRRRKSAAPSPTKRRSATATAARARPVTKVDAGPAVPIAEPTPASEPPLDRPDVTADPGASAERAARIVHQAATILEEEIAMGVVAAQSLERRFIDVETLRSGDPEEVIQRFRKDAHEVVDIFLDLAHVASRSLGEVASKAVRLVPVSIGAPRSAPAASRPAASPMPTLQIPNVVPPGGSSEVMLSIENDTESPTVAFEFVNTDLVDPEGHRIPADRVTFSTTTLSVEPHTSKQVGVRLDVPEDTPAGRYSGLLQASRMDSVRAILLADIG